MPFGPQGMFLLQCCGWSLWRILSPRQTRCALSSCLKGSVEFLSSNSSTKHFFWVGPHFVCLMHAHLDRYTVLPMISPYSTGPQVAVIYQETQQCTNRVWEEEDCKLDVNNAGVKILKKSALRMFFMKKEAHSLLLDLNDKHNAFWWVTMNANITCVCLQEISTGHL